MKLFSIAAAFLFLGNAFFGDCSAVSAASSNASSFQGAPAGLIHWGRVKRDVVIENCEVGGLPYDEAETLIRSKLSFPPLLIRAPSGNLLVDSELTCSDNAAYLVRHAKRGERLSVTVTRRWADMESELYALCRKNSRPALDAEMSFSAKGFTYTPETAGLACDYRGLLRDVTDALSSGISEVTLCVREYSPQITEQLLRKQTQKLASFTTCFDETNAPRTHNIALAASRISGITLFPGQEFSFNGTVGERTEKNGFEIANVIEGGQFVPGFGGGVCQVSTTLFGAALRAGMKITQSRAHSLSVGYVPPSLDAMVSSVSDLCFVNPFETPVFLLARIFGGSITFTLYGLPDGKRYETESVVLSKIAPPEPEIVEGEEGVITKEKEGIKSESYLLVYDGSGKLLSRTRIRKDCYAAVRGKIGAGKEETQIPSEEDMPPEKENF